MIVKILGVIGLLTAFFASYQYLETRYAKAATTAQEISVIKEEAKKDSQRLDYKIKGDVKEDKQKRIYVIEDRYKNKPMPETVKEEYRKLTEEKEKLEKEINTLEKQMMEKK